MAKRNPSSRFTNSAPEEPFGPPLIGALLRVPWEAVQRHMLERLHEHGFDDLDAAHLTVFQYPGRRARGRPTWPPGCGSANKPSTTCSASSSASTTSSADQIPTTCAPNASP